MGFLFKQKVIKTPSLFWRRTGQIFKANNEYVSFQSKRKMEGG